MIGSALCRFVCIPNTLAACSKYRTQRRHLNGNFCPFFFPLKAQISTVPSGTCSGLPAQTSLRVRRKLEMGDEGWRGISHSRLPSPLPQSPCFLIGSGKSSFTQGLLCCWKQCKFILAPQRGPTLPHSGWLCGKGVKSLGFRPSVPLYLIAMCSFGEMDKTFFQLPIDLS